VIILSGAAKAQADTLFKKLSASGNFKPELDPKEFKARNPGFIYYADVSQQQAAKDLNKVLAAQQKPMTVAPYTPTLRKLYGTKPLGAGERHPLIVFPREK
jgi:hypothetical protein